MTDTKAIKRVVEEMRQSDDVQVRYCAERIATAIESDAQSAGWKLVPVEPTPEMKAAGYKVFHYDERCYPENYWDAMLAAAPTKE